MTVDLTLDNILPSINGKVITLFGDISKKRNLFIKQFIFDGFAKDETVCIVSLTSSANTLIEELSNFHEEAGMIVNDAIFNEKLQIVDMYSFRGIEGEDPIPGTHIMPNANDLTMLSIKLNQISRNHPKLRIIIWPYSLLVIYTNLRDIINFTQTLSSRVNIRKQSVLLVADSGVIPEQETNVIVSVVDCVMETRRDDTHEGVKESFRVRFYKGVDKYEYENWTLMLD